MPQVEGEATLPRDLSPWGMFMAADHVVKAVMISLALASVLSWTVWLAKSLELLGAKRRARTGIRALAQSHSLHEGTERLRKTGGPIAAFARAAETEIKLSADAIEKDGVKERVGSRLERIEAAAGRRMNRGTGILATIGSIGPFVGLFGTVWGIMNSFIGISKAQTTNLAVVAPGIAEALLATALGLAAAIPAVVIFNVFSRSITGYRGLLGDGAAEVMRLVSRDLDRATAYPPARQRAPAERRGVDPMGVSLKTGGDDELAPVSEINVTPFIDVILVLLIIFMIAAPLATVDVAVDLPASNAPREPRPKKPIFLTIKQDRTLALGEEGVARDVLASAIDRATSGDKQQRLFVRADKAVSYGEVMEVMNLLRAGGYLKIALVGLETPR